MEYTTEKEQSQEENWRTRIAKMEAEVASMRPPLHLIAQLREGKRMNKVKAFWASPWIDGFLAGLLTAGILFLVF